MQNVETALKFELRWFSHRRSPRTTQLFTYLLNLRTTCHAHIC